SQNTERPRSNAGLLKTSRRTKYERMENGLGKKSSNNEQLTVANQQFAEKARSKRVTSKKKVVPPARFQRATFRLGGGRSMQLSYGSTSAVTLTDQVFECPARRKPKKAGSKSLGTDFGVRRLFNALTLITQ